MMLPSWHMLRSMLQICLCASSAAQSGDAAASVIALPANETCSSAELLADAHQRCSTVHASVALRLQQDTSKRRSDVAHWSNTVIA